MMDSDNLSDYSYDFEDDQSSKVPSKELATPVHPPPQEHWTEPHRKARSQYVLPSKTNPKKLKPTGRSMSEKPMKRGMPFSPRDRELSAKIHSINNLRNQLTQCQRELREAKKENKLLNRLQVRQEKELTKVQTQEGELPQILARHSEELRVLREQLKRSQESSTAHQSKVHSLTLEIQKMRNRGKKLEEVAKRKNLLERESLTLQLQDVNDKIQGKDRKLKELEKGIETLHKTYGQEIRSLMLKNKSLTQDVDTAQQRAEKLLSQLKERNKEMEVMNIYSQRMGRRSLNSSLTIEDPLLSTDTYSQTDITCPPTKKVTMQTKSSLKSSSSQTQPVPVKTTETRTTQTSPPNVSPVEITPQKQPVKAEPVLTTQQQMEKEPSPVKQEVVRVQSPAEKDEEKQRKDLLLSRLRALDGQKGPPASQPVASITDVSSPTPQQVNNAIATNQQTIASGSLYTKQDEEAKKKKLLLAKLMAIDEGSDPIKVQSPASKLNATVDSARSVKADRNGSGKSNASVHSLQAETMENLHKGKPAFFTQEDPFGSKHSFGRNTIKTQPTAKTGTKGNENNLEVKPVYGRRARNTGDLFEDTPKTQPPLFNGLSSGSGTKSRTIFDSEVSSASTKDYPWERRVNIDSNPLNQGPANQSMVFGPNSKSSLLPLRPKAEANRVEMIPGGIIAEPDDLEELVL